MLRVQVTARMLRFFVKLGHPPELCDSDADEGVTSCFKRGVLHCSEEEKIGAQRK